MTKRGAGESDKDTSEEMADMNYRNLEDEGSESGENSRPTTDGGNKLHPVNVEPTVEMGGQSTGRGPRRIRGGMMYKSVGCSKFMAICLLLLILGSILLIAIVASFARPRCLKAQNNTSETLPEVKPTALVDTEGNPFPWTNIRLPKDIKPLNYTIFLHPNLTTSEVLGHIEIVLQAINDCDFIVLHIADMNVTKPAQIVPKVKGTNLKSISVEKMQVNEKNEMIYLKLASKIPKGKLYILYLDFSYTLGDGLKGFYRSTYKVGTEERVLATTQMEPTDARKAFPCFDEPNLKATFEITLIREERHITLSNMPLRQSKPYTKSKFPGLVQDDYKVSVIMSTYLVAFVVCDFKNISDVTDSPIPAQVAVYASEDKLEQTQLALDVLKYTIPQYERYFGVKYPLPKQDMIAIPDFAAGAMENWGLITYRQASILNKENVTSDSSKQWIIQTITHELAHQWFGNIVTMDWWTDLWLNEGFASYVMYIGTDMWQARDNRGWRMKEQFVVSTIQDAMYADSKADSHPILVEVQSPGQINEIFDDISYSKGASVIWMLNDYVTEDVFRSGLTSYLIKYQYANAKTEDLWNAIANARKNFGKHFEEISIADMMDTWTRQMGYPVVTITRSANKANIKATQKHFLLYSKAVASDEFHSDYKYKWTIPLTVVTSDNSQPTALSSSQRTVFHRDQESTTISISARASWYKVNYNQTGFYRVNYDIDNWSKLKEQILTDHLKLNPTDRAGIIDDAFNLAWSGQLDYNIPLEMSEYLNNEEDYIPWSSALSGLGSIGVLLRNKEGYPYYQEYMLKKLDILLKKIGWDDTGEHLKKFLRDSVFYRAVVYGHVESVNQAQAMFKNWKENNVSVSSNLMRTVYCAGVMYGQKADWDYCWKKYKESIVPTEKRMLQRALGCTYSPTLLNKYLYLSIDKEQIRLQDTIGVIATVAGHAAGASAAVKFVIDNWDVIVKRYGKSSFDLADLIGSVTASISSQFEFDQVKSFLKKNSEEAKSGQRAIRQALETMQMNIDWIKDNEEKVTEWFKNKVSSNNV